MKTLLIALLAFSFTVQAKSRRPVERPFCALGETTGDLSDKMELPSGKRIWYKGEHLSIHNEQRAKALTKLEKGMIHIASGSSQTEAEALKDFYTSDGYLTYFSHNSNGREFVIVAAYPGDNEFGAILEIQTLKKKKKEYKILSVVATISDGDLMDCTVNTEE